MCSKKESVKKTLNRLYTSPAKLIVSRRQIKKIEKHYIKNRLKYNNVKDFAESDAEIGKLVNQLKSGKCEIDKQLKAGKALQPGVLFECVVAQTCAKLMGLKGFVDFENTPMAKVPKEAARYVKESAYTACAARYAYYKKSDKENAIVQYGNPNAGDMGIITDGEECKVEIKDMPALLMDKDLLYDEDGKIIITDEIKNDYPEYVKYIQEFNKNTSMIEKMGGNYKLFADGDSKAINFVKSFLNASDIDIIVTATEKKDELIGLTPKLIDYTFSNNTPLITVNGSEIRTTGKNSRAGAFTPAYLDSILAEKDISVDDNGVCFVKPDNLKVIGKIPGRGRDKETATRFKLSNAFYVKIDDITETDDFISFPKNKIRQSKGGISIHIGVKHQKEDIKNVMLQASTDVTNSIHQVA